MSDSLATKYVLTCPGCQKRFQLLDAAILGKRATCKSCKAPFLVDGSVLTKFEPEDMPKPKEPIVESTSSEIVTDSPAHSNIALTHDQLFGSFAKDIKPFVLIGGLVAIVFMIIWVSDWQSNTRYFPAMWTLQILLCVVVPLAYGLKKHLRFGCFALMPILWIYTARNAQITRRWEKNEISYVDSEWRYSGTVFHQYRSSADFSMSGDISESGRMHGKWTFISYKPLYSEDMYYWYGDKVTEGEFRLRSK